MRPPEVELTRRWEFPRRRGASLLMPYLLLHEGRRDVLANR